jgi:hypothetical protein
MPESGHELTPARTSAPDTNLPAGRVARVLEREGRQWLVFEHVRPFDRRSSPDLVFESDAVVRRVRNYPADWHRLTSDQLWALFESR